MWNILNILEGFSVEHPWNIGKEKTLKIITPPVLSKIFREIFDAVFGFITEIWRTRPRNNNPSLFYRKITHPYAIFGLYTEIRRNLPRNNNPPVLSENFRENFDAVFGFLTEIRRNFPRNNNPPLFYRKIFGRKMLQGGGLCFLFFSIWKVQ